MMPCLSERGSWEACLICHLASPGRRDQRWQTRKSVPTPYAIGVPPNASVLHPHNGSAYDAILAVLTGRDREDFIQSIEASLPDPAKRAALRPAQDRFDKLMAASFEKSFH